MKEQPFTMSLSLVANETLPIDGMAGALVGRVWFPGGQGEIEGPRVVALRPEGFVDISGVSPTMSGLLDMPNAAERIRECSGLIVGSLDEVLTNISGALNSAEVSGPYLLAPCDLQVIKAAGVTFAGSLIER